MTQLPPSHVQQLLGKRDRAHDRAYDRTRADDPMKRALSSARWRKLRALKLSRSPLCELCEEAGRTAAATQVHHREPRHERPDLMWTMGNLESVCDPCHARASAEERAK